jgi:HSP20 family protein
VERLRAELDRWMDAAWSQGERAIDAIGLRAGRGWTPPIDVIEDADSVRVIVNVPGVDASSIEVTVAGHMLTVSGVLPGVDAGVQGQRLSQERPVGEFRRSIPLPACVDPDRVSASSHHGVLTVTIAKSEQLKARKIPVSSSVLS